VTPNASLDNTLFRQIAEFNHEQVSLWYDPDSAYRGIIAIHNTALGRALGGTRFWDYTNDAQALNDVLRLSRGMTYKAAIAGLNLGGGKSVILGDNKTARREGVFRSHGRHVESLKGRYITAEDVNTSPADMDWIHQETEHVVGLKDKSGNPSPVTAYGVYRGMKACAKFVWGKDDLSGKTVTLQGCGSVGYFLAELLAQEGAKLIVTDIDADKVKKIVADFKATAVAPDAIYGRQADIFAPCALGAVIDDKTIPQLKVKIVAGGANNQLAEARHGDVLAERGIVYAPDYAINGGGLINVNAELEGWSRERARDKAGHIYDTILEVLELAQRKKISSHVAADEVALTRIKAAEQAKGLSHRP
jgi:leucine dehydrogenase